MVHFQDTKSDLDDLVILNPQELANVMSSVVSFNTNWKDGIVSTSHLQLAWKKYPREIHSKLVSLLEKFEVGFRLKHKKDHLFIPNLLPAAIPSAEVMQQLWISPYAGDFHQIGRVYDFPFVPLGFFPRLMTRVIHQFQQELSEEKLTLWRTGLIMQLKDGSSLMIRYNTQKYRLKIFAKWAEIPDSHSATAERAFTTLVQAIETLLEGYYSPEIQDAERQIRRSIPCSHCMNGTNGKSSVKNVHLFAYEECAKGITAGLTTVVCKPSDKNIRIDYIAPDVAFAGIPVLQMKDITVEQKIGEGGFGTVYKGLLRTPQGSATGIPVAIKELKMPESQEDYMEKFEEFKREAFIMNCLNHQNLVKLYGITLAPKMSLVLEYVGGGDLHHKFHVNDPSLEDAKAKLKVDKKVYDQEWKDFMSNLPNYNESEKRDHFVKYEAKRKDLYDREEKLVEDQTRLDEEKISWKLRVKVALDIAHGMSYLHTIVPPIVHRDLRSPNVFVRLFDI